MGCETTKESTMRKLFDWLNLEHYLSGAAHAAVGIICLGALYATFVSVAGNAAMTGVGAQQKGLVLASDVAGRTESRSNVMDVDARLSLAASTLEQERHCLATGIYFEARGEAYYGQLAVAEVILNRVASRRYPNTVCKVVFQGSHRRNACQFSFACDGLSDRPREQLSWRRATRLARYATTSGQRQAIIGGATHYHADYVKPHWASAFVEVAKIGRHIFYKTTKSSS